MITLRLFKAADPFLQIEARPLGQGDLVIGRDPAADWPIVDGHELSRRHCILSLDNQRIFLRDVSLNGVTTGVERRPVPREERFELRPGETLYLGEFMILIDADGEQEAAVPSAAAPSAAVGAPSMPPPAALTDAALLEAFCDGARLEPFAFAGEDPAAVMTRLGAAYRQVIEDLSVMMRDRTRIKTELHMDRTTISSRDNNPLKWAPPERVSVDLLKEGEGGFLKGASAIKSSFEDLRRHGVCVMAGSDAVLHFVLTEFEPQSLEVAARRYGSPFASKYEGMWKLFRERHAGLSEGGADAALDQAFRTGYERRLALLEDEGEEAA